MTLIIQFVQTKEFIMAEIPAMKTRSVVLGHGGFAAGSGWEDIYQILRKE
jgi:hypothetical protein